MQVVDISAAGTGNRNTACRCDKVRDKAPQSTLMEMGRTHGERKESTERGGKRERRERGEQ